MPSAAVHILPLLRSFEHTVSELCGDPSFPASDLRRLFSKLKSVAKTFSTYDCPICINWEWENEENATPCVWISNDLHASISGRTKSDLFSIVINRHGNILGNKNYEMDGANIRDSVFATHVSLASADSVVFYFYDTQFFVYYKGCMVEHLPNVFKESDIRGAINKYSYEAKDYSNLIREHFSDYVENEQVTKHWQNRKERTLRPAPEAIFRDSLWKFLEENVVDAILVQKEQVIKGTTSKVDISIQTLNSSYLIEIKWLGRASKKDSTGTSNGLKRALAGARQVIRYIEMSKGDIVKGILVMYDARENNEEISWGDKESHHLLDKDFRLWLRSDSASQA